MSKEDKQFFTGLVKGLQQQITNVESNLRTDFRSEMSELRSGLQDEMLGLKTDLESQIRHNGVLIEKMQDDIELLCEGHETMHGQLKKVAEDVEEIKENTHDLPIIRQTVTSHSVALLELSK